jgi:nucleotide-binding universal stress UspA family protein
MTTVLVPLDGSTHATAALPVARVLAELEDASLRILHVGQPFLPPREFFDRLGLTPEDVQGLVLDQATGPPAESIVRLARHWRSVLIVLCTHTRQTKPRRALGSVAEQVLLDAPCPVVLVHPERGRRSWAVRRIVLPHDGTPTTAAALGPAMELAQRSGAELDVLHVPTSDAPTEPDGVTAPQYLDQPQHEWPLWAREFLERTLGPSNGPPAVQARPVLRRGAPEAEILRFARECEGDLIVLAWHGSLEPGRARIMRQILRETPCPVLALRAEEHAGHGGGTAATWPARDRSSSEQTPPDAIPEGGHPP